MPQGRRCERRVKQEIILDQQVKYSRHLIAINTDKVAVRDRFEHERETRRTQSHDPQGNRNIRITLSSERN